MIWIHLATLTAALVAAFYAHRAVRLLRQLAARRATVVNPTVELEQLGAPA